MDTSTVIKTVKNELRLNEWATQLETQQRSGLPVRKWRAENGISAKTYYYRLYIPLRLPQLHGHFAHACR